MSLLGKWFRKRLCEPRFEDYKITTGYTVPDHAPYAMIHELASITIGKTHEEAILNLRLRFEERIEQIKECGAKIPLPGSTRQTKISFAPNDQIEALRPCVEEFWSEILGTSYATSFVSNQSQLSSWEQYVSGGRPSLIQKVEDRYGVDISAYYDEPIPVVLERILQSRTR